MLLFDSWTLEEMKPSQGIEICIAAGPPDEVVGPHSTLDSKSTSSASSLRPIFEADQIGT